MSKSIFEKNCSYVIKYRAWKYFANGKADYKDICDTFVVLDHKTEYGIDERYFLKSPSGEKFWVKERHIMSLTKIDSKYNGRTHQDVEDCFFQLRDEHKPDWYRFLANKYGNENVSFRSKTGWVTYPFGRQVQEQDRRTVLETFPEKKGVHTEYENDFLLSSWKRRGKEVWIEKEGKYDESYREHYYPGEKEKFLQEVYESKINAIWDFFESIFVYVNRFQVLEGNIVWGLPNRDAINFVKELNLEKGVYERNKWT